MVGWLVGWLDVWLLYYVIIVFMSLVGLMFINDHVFMVWFGGSFGWMFLLYARPTVA